MANWDDDDEHVIRSSKPDKRFCRVQWIPLFFIDGSDPLLKGINVLKDYEVIGSTEASFLEFPR
jgi:hypothetical protein